MMRWLMTGCLLGGLGALLKHWQWPYATWVSVAGVVILVLGFLNWLSAYGSGASRRGSSSGDGWTSADFDCGGGDGGGGDGGCGGD